MSREVMYMARGRPAKCPYCGGSSINKGFRKTKTMGKRRIKLCKACGRKFTPKNQKPIEAIGENTTETNVQQDEATEVSDIAEPNKTDESGEAATEPVDNPKPLLNALGKEWT